MPLSPAVQWLPEHVSPLAHIPQPSMPPQPSATNPQSSPDGHVVIGTQAHAPLLQTSVPEQGAQALPPVPQADADCEP